MSTKALPPGEGDYVRGLVAALLGRRAEAVSLPREAMKDNGFYRINLHAHPAVDRLRGYPPFEDLVRPRGEPAPRPFGAAATTAEVL